MFRILKGFTASKGTLSLAVALALWNIHHRQAFTTPIPKRSEVIRGEYQNKIRRYSPPEKIFEVFATHYENGQLFMDCMDLMKAICFYNYCSKTEIPTDYKPEGIIQFVGGEDDRISIYDYFNLLAFMEIDENRITRKKQATEKLDQEAIYQMLKKAHKRTNTSLKSTLLLESRRVKIDQQKYEQSIRKCAHMLYTKDKINKKWDILVLRRKFLKEIYKFEFLSIPKDENGTIDSQDFAKSIIRFIQHNKLHKYIVKSQQIVLPNRITLNQYVGFHLYLQYKIKPLKDLCSSKGALTAAQIHETLNDDNQSYKDKYQLEKAQSDIFLMLLDEDSSGFVEKRELETILNNVQYYYTSIAKPDNALNKIQKDWTVWREKLRRIRDIIAE